MPGATPWVFDGAWDGRNVQDLPAIMCDVMAKINKRWEVLGLEGWVQDYVAPNWSDGEGHTLGPGVYPTPADYDGMPISSMIPRTLYSSAVFQVSKLAEINTVGRDPDNDLWYLKAREGHVIVNCRSFQYVENKEADADPPETYDDMLVSVPWTPGTLPLSSTYKGPAGRGIEPWIALRDYIDRLTVVRFAWTDGDMVDGVGASEGAFGDYALVTGASEEAKWEAMRDYAADCVDGIFAEAAVSFPPWDPEATLSTARYVFAEQHNLSVIQWGVETLQQKTGTDPYYYNAAGFARTNTGADSASDFMADVLGENVRSVVRVYTGTVPWSDTFDYSIIINADSKGVPTPGGSVIEMTPDGDAPVPDAFTVLWEEVPSAAPVDMHTVGEYPGSSDGRSAALYLCFCVWRDMTAEL